MLCCAVFAVWYDMIDDEEYERRRYFYRYLLQSSLSLHLIVQFVILSTCARDSPSGVRYSSLSFTLWVIIKTS